MYYPYCTIGEDFEVTHSKWDGKCTKVRFEKPDEKYGFKTMECAIPGYDLSDIVGFTGNEIMELIGFCKSHADCLVEYSKVGGITNA